MLVVHDKGISRLASQMKVERGKWYFGFICKECGAKIFYWKIQCKRKSAQLRSGMANLVSHAGHADAMK
jgi:hypothetical protein